MTSWTLLKIETPGTRTPPARSCKNVLWTLALGSVAPRGQNHRSLFSEQLPAARQRDKRLSEP